LDKRIRKKIAGKLLGLEYRQQSRMAQRAMHARAARIRKMMQQKGTLNGARKYLELKGVGYHQSIDEDTGNIVLSVPGQVALVYGPDGKFLSSGPAVVPT